MPTQAIYRLVYRYASGRLDTLRRIMATMTHKKTTQANADGRRTKANPAGVPKSRSALRKAGRAFIVEHRKTYETLAK